MAEDAPEPAAHREASADTRAAAKWLIAAFAGVGGLLLTGIGLSSFGEIEGGDRLTIAIVAFSVAILAVIAAISLIADVLTPTPVTLTDLARFERRRNDGSDAERDDELVAYFEDDPTMLQGMIDVTRCPKRNLLATASDKYTEALTDRFTSSEAYWQARREHGKGSDEVKAAEALGEVADKRSATMHATVRRLEKVATAQRTVFAFRRRRPLIGFSAVVIAFAIGAFAFAANPPEAPRADLHGAKLIDVDLSGASLREADLAGMTVERVNFEGTNLEGAKTEKTVWKDTVCPDGTNSDNAGGSCDGHLDPGFEPAALP